MLPYSTLIIINKGAKTPVYLQISNSIISLIKKGILQKGGKLPGSRLLSGKLEVHRNTVVAAYEELSNQGWITIKPSKGAYISEALPEIKPKVLKDLKAHSKGMETGYVIKNNNILTNNVYKKTGLIEINDGMPDERLAPMESLSRAIRSVLVGQRGRTFLSYSDIEGNKNLRIELMNYLNHTRGFDLKIENIFISRGTIHALYLCCGVLLTRGDNVIVAELGYRAINLIVENIGAKLIKVPIDHQGLCIEAIERICKIRKIRAIYVTPHHHYPTTVTMPPERRIALLALAEKYKIAILEDDYDYDYHFQHSPFLPLASADPMGLVIYIGSFSKTFSPAFRVGYIAAPQNLIQEITKLRRIVDRQGDSILEQALSELFKLGEIENHLRKTQKEYLKRRDVFCNTLSSVLNNKVKFKIPEGGMAVWAELDNKFPLEIVSKKAAAKGLFITDGKYFKQGNINLNATRLGFASLNTEECEKAILLLDETLKELK